MTRRNALTAALTAPFTMAAAAIAPLRSTKTTPAPAPVQLAAPPVTQAELQAVIDAWSHMERQATNIRRRLESGAGMERGRLGVSTCAMESLEECLKYSEADGVDGVGGLMIMPVEDLAYQVELLKQCKDPDWYVLV